MSKDAVIAPPLQPAVHPMDPRRSETLSPMFAAFLCWLLGIEPQTTPAITGIALAGDVVLASTTRNPFHDAYLGSLPDFEANIRGWGKAAGADPATIDDLLAALRRCAV